MAERLRHRGHFVDDFRNVYSFFPGEGVNETHKYGTRAGDVTVSKMRVSSLPTRLSALNTSSLLVVFELMLVLKWGRMSPRRREGWLVACVGACLLVDD